MPSSRQTWRTASAYGYLDDLSVAGLAWEGLRRNPRYRQDYSHSQAPTQQSDSLDALIQARWGLRFPGPSGAHSS